MNVPFTYPSSYPKQNSAIFPLSAFSVAVESFSVRSVETFNICVERADCSNAIQMRLCSANDQSRMFLCTVDLALFEKIKLDQALHVSFDGFVNHLTKILESCKKHELYVLLVNEERTHTIQFYEKRSFRNLIHLYLPLEEAPVAVILYHINQSLIQQQETNVCNTNQIQKLQRETQTKGECILELREEIKRLEKAVSDKENVIFEKNSEENKRLQHSMQRLIETRDHEEKRLKNIINQQHEKYDTLQQDHKRVADELASQCKINETVREEWNVMRQSNATLKEQTDRVHSELLQLQTRDRKNELILVDYKKRLTELQGTVKKFDKIKSDLLADIEAEKSITQSKRNALVIATEEISKANGIIQKQSEQIVHLKKTVELRTEVAFQQEISLKGKEKLTCELFDRLSSIETEHKRTAAMGASLGQTIKEMHEKANVLEEKYRKKIEDIRNTLPSQSSRNVNERRPSTGITHQSRDN